jgi:hypothetical protein
MAPPLPFQVQIHAKRRWRGGCPKRRPALKNPLQKRDENTVALTPPFCLGPNRIDPDARCWGRIAALIDLFARADTLLIQILPATLTKNALGLGANETANNEAPDLFGFKSRQGDLFANEPPRNNGVGVADPDDISRPPPQNARGGQGGRVFPAME